jgi:hypothetical protein
MATIISPSDNNLYRIGQKVFFYSDLSSGTTWSLDPVNSITSNEVAILETFGVTDIEGIDYDYCLVRFVGTGDFYIRLTNITGSDSFTKVILGIDVIWVGAKTTLWSTDVGKLCRGLTSNFDIQQVNKWSLFKPVRSAERDLGERDIWASVSLFKRNGAGLRIVKWDSTYSNISFYWFLYSLSLPSDGSWDYENPRGITDQRKEYLRLGDFRGYTEKYNRSAFSEVLSSPTIYRKEISGTFNKENWDSYSLENNNLSSSMLLSDIWLGESENTNLGEAYLMVYVRHSTTNRHFFKKLIKLSEQQNGDFTIQTPLEDLFSTLLTSNTFFEDKGLLDRFYFIATEVINNDDWIEVTGTNGIEHVVYYPPSTVMRSQRHLANIFKEALAVPVTTITKNYIASSNIIYYTEIPINIINQYSLTRNIYLDVMEGNIKKFAYFREHSSSESNSSVIKNILNNVNYSIDYKYSFRYDTLFVGLNSPYTFNNWYRPTLANKDKISVNLKTVLAEVDELLWYNAPINIILLEESIYINFYNQIGSNKTIEIEFLNSRNVKKLILAPGESGKLLDLNDNPYKLRNLSQYNLKISTLEKDSMDQAQTIIITDNSIDRLTSTYQIEDIIYINTSLTTNLGNGYFDNDITPLDVYITINF